MALLELEGVTGGYGDVRVLHGIDIAVEEGQVGVVLGANGAGKTTTIRVLCGLLRPSAGEGSVASAALDGDERAIKARAAFAAAAAAAAVVVTADAPPAREPEGGRRRARLAGTRAVQVRRVLAQRGGAADRRRPATGEPRKLVHSIERWNLDHLPGEKTIFLSWQSLEEGLKTILAGAKTVAMEYSPGNAIPYISKVDAGTIEAVRKTGVEIVSSMDLTQFFESRWTEEAYRDNLETARIMRGIVDETFGFMKSNVVAMKKVTEYDVQQFMLGKFAANGLVTMEAPNCSVNANSGNPHYEPTKEVHAELREGDFVLIDLWAKKDRPGSTYNDITWTGFLGTSAPEKYAKVFNVVRDAAGFLRNTKRLCG